MDPSGTPWSTRKCLTLPTRRSESALLYSGSAARIRMTGKGQTRIRLNLQEVLEVRCQGGENLLLASCQTLIRGASHSAKLSGRKRCAAGDSAEEVVVAEAAPECRGWCLPVAVWPLSSDTLQVIRTGPEDAPDEEYVAVVPLAGDGAARRLVAVGERAILRADTLTCNGRRVSRLEIGRAR